MQTGQAGRVTAVMRWMAKVRVESLRSSYAITWPPSTRWGSDGAFGDRAVVADVADDEGLA